jgi:hypothetical protein
MCLLESICPLRVRSLSPVDQVTLRGFCLGPHLDSRKECANPEEIRTTTPDLGVAFCLRIVRSTFPSRTTPNELANPDAMFVVSFRLVDQMNSIEATHFLNDIRPPGNYRAVVLRSMIVPTTPPRGTT